MKLYLDDMRPAPIGWTLAKTVEEAKTILLNNEVSEASLDHDLGACADCMKGRTPEQWLVESHYKTMPNCEHFGTGYTLLCWMEKENVWPKDRVLIHTANAEARKKMNDVLLRREP